jgi:chitinase
LYRIDRRDTPPEELHLLHERWYTANLVDWVAKLGSVQKEVKVLDQKVSKTFIYQILSEHRTCMISENTQATVEADLHALITADVQTSGVLTLIGNMVRIIHLLLLCHLSRYVYANMLAVMNRMI